MTGYRVHNEPVPEPEPEPVFLPSNANTVFLTQRRKDAEAQRTHMERQAYFPQATHVDYSSAGLNCAFTSGKGAFVIGRTATPVLDGDKWYDTGPLPPPVILSIPRPGPPAVTHGLTSKVSSPEL